MASFAEKLANVVSRHDEISALLSSPDVGADDLVRMNKELAALTPVVEAIHEYNHAEKNMADAKAMMDDSSLDKEMREMAEAEFYELKEKLPELESRLKFFCCPKMPKTKKTRFSKFVPAPAVMKPLCSEPCCLKCINAIRLCRAGNLKPLTWMKTAWAATSRQPPKSPAKMFLPN